MDSSDDAFSKALKFHLDNGTTTVIPTSCTSSKADIVSFIEFARNYVKRNVTEARLIEGIHLERPYLSVRNKGAQKEDYLAVPNKDDYSYLLEYSDIIKIITISPELPGAEKMTKAYAALSTRVLPISRETQTINAYGYQRGDLRGMPKWCITVGMKPILNARKIYIALNRDWQHGIEKHVLFDTPTSSIPATLLQKHNNTVICAYESIANGLL